jgi:hypothetical protein
MLYFVQTVRVTKGTAAGSEMAMNQATNELIDKVNAFALDGWIPQGGIECVVRGIEIYLMQALVKEGQWRMEQ